MSLNHIDLDYCMLASVLNSNTTRSYCSVQSKINSNSELKIKDNLVAGVEHVAGGMFTSVPNGDAIFMKVSLQFSKPKSISK